jgi:hypothetical protein
LSILGGLTAVAAYSIASLNQKCGP